MKTRHLLLITLLILAATSIKAQTKTVELPGPRFPIPESLKSERWY